MVLRMGYLTREEWETFSTLFEKKEGTNYYDTRELAKMVLLNVADSETYFKVENDNKVTITDILQLLHTITGASMEPKQ